MEFGAVAAIVISALVFISSRIDRRDIATGDYVRSLEDRVRACEAEKDTLRRQRLQDQTVIQGLHDRITYLERRLLDSLDGKKEASL